MQFDRKEQIRELERQIAESKTKNIELENMLLKLKLADMEENYQQNNTQQTLLKG